MQRPSVFDLKTIGQRGIKKFPLFWIAVLTGMASLLLMVGVLQYRWTRELSVAAEARIGSTLQPLMLGWHLDFYSELSAICVELQVGPDSGAHDAWDDYLQRYAEWNQSGASAEIREGVIGNSELVREIYDWQTSAPGNPALLRLNPKGKTLDAVSVPPELETLLVRLQSNSANLRMALRAWEYQPFAENGHPAENNRPSTIGLRTNALAGWQLDDSIPALVHPVLHHSNPFNSQTPVGRVAVDWLVVVLNLDYIQKEILPSLTTRYFTGSDGLEYKVAVIDEGKIPRRLIYSSDVAFPSGNGDTFDSEMNIFGPPPESIAGRYWQSSKNDESLEWRKFLAPVWFPVIQYASHEEPWMLLLEHRTGPLQAVAKSIWRRNLMTGGVVLLLLTVGMTLVLFASRRAQMLAKLQIDFVAAVSHELLTPLAAIYCTGENFMDGLVRTEADAIAHGSIITGQARQLTDMVRQILLFASTQNGTIRYSLRPLQVSDILDSVSKNVLMLVEGNGFTVEQDIPAGLPDVMGDQSALAQCIQNLILNAVKYSGKSRWIGISASVQELKNHRNEIQISVQDHGTGISSSDLPHVFEPFFRSPSAVDAQIHGTGLGLAVAKRIANAMGGNLTVVSEVGLGSTFTLHLPVQWRVDRVLAVTVPESIQGRRNE
jgi:signal transduction histidine kinase